MTFLSVILWILTFFFIFIYLIFTVIPTDSDSRAGKLHLYTSSIYTVIELYYSLFFFLKTTTCVCQWFESVLWTWIISYKKTHLNFVQSLKGVRILANVPTQLWWLCWSLLSFLHWWSLDSSSTKRLVDPCPHLTIHCTSTANELSPMWSTPTNWLRMQK